MSYGDPRKLLEGALNEFPDHRDRFEADFAHWLSYSGLLAALDTDHHTYNWARWAFWSAGDYGRKE